MREKGERGQRVVFFGSGTLPHVRTKWMLRPVRFHVSSVQMASLTPALSKGEGDVTQAVVNRQFAVSFAKCLCAANYLLTLTPAYSVDT